ncbi:translocation protein [Jimgerdemannia flammicorona]|uniref:Translocation protein SEC62 n=1 Tax=Jimgerdemannia flammicorona TaxID=994334 RepID=A0A433A0F0_9FUNG|nr:translocation protein [Jimgerdemannia flammicorona]
MDHDHDHDHDHDRDHDHDHDHDHHGHGHGHDHSHAPVRVQVSEPSKATPDVLIAAKYLRDIKKSTMKLRQGQFNGKRVDYFKGKSAINALLRPSYAASTPNSRRPITNRDEAHRMIFDLGVSGFFLHVERGESPGKGTPRPLQISRAQTVNEDWYYLWVWEGSQWLLYLTAAGMVLAVLAAVMFPLWPPILRLGVWYLSVGILGLLGVFMGIAIVRLILYVITMVVLSPGIWIFPNLFEDVGIVESFIPFWEWDKPKVKKMKAGKAEERDEDGEEEGEGEELQEGKRRVMVEEEADEDEKSKDD